MPHTIGLAATAQTPVTLAWLPASPIPALPESPPPLPPLPDYSGLIDLYTALSGGLAAIAFAGIAIYLSRPLTEEGQTNLTEPLLYNMGSLVVCAFTFANLMPVPKDEPWLVYALMIAGPVVGLAVVALFHSAALMLLSVNRTKEVGHLASSLASGLSPVVLFFLIPVTTAIYVDSQNLEELRRNPFALPRWPWLVAIILSLVGFSQIRIPVIDSLLDAIAKRNPGTSKSPKASGPARFVFMLSIASAAFIQAWVRPQGLPACGNDHQYACHEAPTKIVSYLILYYSFIAILVMMAACKVSVIRLLNTEP